MTNEKIIVVDEKDNIIGYKERDELKPEDIYRVSALWVTDKSGQILLAQRSFRKSHDPGKWGPAAAGTVEEGETYHSSIIKEAQEELGLENIKPEVNLKERVSGRYNFFVQWYFLLMDNPKIKFKINKDEVEEIKWFSRDNLIREMENDPDKFFIETMSRWLKFVK